MKHTIIIPSIILMQLAFTFYHLTYRELWVIRLNRRVVTALVNRNKPKPIPFVTEYKL